MRTTERGFEVYEELTDSYGATITVRESSAASGPHAWLSIKGGGIESNDGASHLNVEQATRVRDALTEFLNRVPERWAIINDREQSD